METDWKLLAHCLSFFLAKDFSPQRIQSRCEIEKDFLIQNIFYKMNACHSIDSHSVTRTDSVYPCAIEHIVRLFLANVVENRHLIELLC